MSARRALAFLAVFAAGFAVARLLPARQAVINTSVLETPFSIYPCDTPGDAFRLTPTRISVDGVRRPLSEPPLGRAPLYRIDAREGRVVLFATREPIP